MANGKLNPHLRAGVEVRDGLWETSKWPAGEGTQELGTAPAPARRQHGAGAPPSRISPVFSSVPLRCSQRGDTLPLRAATHESPWLRKAGGTGEGLPTGLPYPAHRLGALSPVRDTPAAPGVLTQGLRVPPPQGSTERGPSRAALQPGKRRRLLRQQRARPGS